MINLTAEEFDQIFFPDEPQKLDVFFKNFFDSSSPFLQIDACERKNIQHPVNVVKHDNEIEFNVACIGLDKDDVQIKIDGDILRVAYDNKKVIKQEKDYIYHGITEKSFNLGWKIGNKYDLTKTEAVMDKGMLIIKIPLSEDKKPKLLNIKVK